MWPAALLTFQDGQCLLQRLDLLLTLLHTLFHGNVRLDTLRLQSIVVLVRIVELILHIIPLVLCSRFLGFMLLLGLLSLLDELLFLTLQTTDGGTFVVAAPTVLKHKFLVCPVVFLLHRLRLSLQTGKITGDDFQKPKNARAGRLLSSVPTARRCCLVIELLQNAQGLGDGGLRLTGISNCRFVFLVLRVSLLGCDLHRFLDVCNLRLQL
mmetsp:Transcript_9429/g.20714  ORF Transcript_9429/g.20714 Transcript_9429/m.20714 type:complete len:210 (+) Transcript_9429:85-714(+)